jgi:hypothetical protein
MMLDFHSIYASFDPIYTFTGFGYKINILNLVHFYRSKSRPQYSTSTNLRSSSTIRTKFSTYDHTS